jgi:hypothetical protein
MEKDWVVGEDGNTDLPFLKSFAIAIAENALLGIRLESNAGATPAFPCDNVQFALTAVDARQLAWALLRAAGETEDKAALGKPN